MNFNFSDIGSLTFQVMGSPSLAHDASKKCHLCLRSEVSAMCPVCTGLKALSGQLFGSPQPTEHSSRSKQPTAFRKPSADRAQLLKPPADSSFRSFQPTANSQQPTANSRQTAAGRKKAVWGDSGCRLTAVRFGNAAC